MSKSKLCLDCNKRKNIKHFSLDKNRKDGRFPYCKKCCTQRANNYRILFPWKITYQKIKARCCNPNNKDYYRYGKRGIKCLIAEEELKKLWLRDKADFMKEPTIDRQNNDGNYIYSNCRYIENIINCSINKRKPVLQYDLQENFIKEWESASEIQRQLKFSQSAISAYCLGNRKVAYGFIWKFKENE